MFAQVGINVGSPMADRLSLCRMRESMAIIVNRVARPAKMKHLISILIRGRLAAVIAISAPLPADPPGGA